MKRRRGHCSTTVDEAGNAGSVKQGQASSQRKQTATGVYVSVVMFEAGRIRQADGQAARSTCANALQQPCYIAFKTSVGVPLSAAYLKAGGMTRPTVSATSIGLGAPPRPGCRLGCKVLQIAPCPRAC